MTCQNAIVYLICISFACVNHGRAENDEQSSIASGSQFETHLTPLVGKDGKGIKFLLTIKNTSRESQRVSLYESLAPILIGASGKWYNYVSGSDASAKPTIRDFPRLAPDEKVEIHFSVTTRRGAEGISLVTEDPFGTARTFAGLPKGQFQLCWIGYDGFKQPFVHKMATEAGVPADAGFEIVSGSNWIGITLK